MFITRNISPAARCSRRRRGDRSAAARCHDSRGHRAGRHRGRRRSRALGFVYFPHGAVMDRWKPEAVGHELRISADPEAARALQGLHDRRHRPAQQGGESSDPARHHCGHLAVLRGTEGSRWHRRPRHHRRPAGRPRTSDRTRRCRRSSSPARAAGGVACAPGVGCGFASTVAFRTPTSRCRWRTTRARCSTDCSGRATRTRSAPRSSRRPAAFSITSGRRRAA